MIYNVTTYIFLQLLYSVTDQIIWLKVGYILSFCEATVALHV